MSCIRLAYLVVVCVLIGAGTTSAETRRQAALIHAEGAVYLDDESVVSPSGAVVLRDSATVRTVGGRAIVALKQGGVLALASRVVPE